MDALSAAMKVASSGLAAQSQRLEVVSQNIANAQSTSRVAGGEPYQRKTITFTSALDQANAAQMVDVDKIGRDPSSFSAKFDPSSPGADAKGMVKMPNVNVLVEMADMRDANRAYESNLQVMKQVQDMVTATIDLMRGG
ncbi:flagellar basal body rod protein FlgC [Ahrensia sp. R2A130]|uniref:flagellar basal body rod protein FlgC n=1 Tax=Ahrensia sp. R2A130 TaxID=744979 RepID=UPI0001E083C7|nr:flagellar basal body rod protein FlgC [Ahrensia sp. R2A130]EFL89498.1 flagellar basal-body rod protein FlgC [Ahrensia sp. R2A130]